jgi:hypothetical protein
MEALTKVEVVRIGDDEIEAVRGSDGQGYAVVRRMCEAMGLDDDAQRVKLKNSSWAVTLTIKATAEDGKNYDCFCLRVDSVAMWLSGIDAGRVSEKVILGDGDWCPRCVASYETIKKNLDRDGSVAEWAARRARNAERRRKAVWP